jgi:cobalt-zinc-cadmium efflux system outer membrane protein
MGVFFSASSAGAEWPSLESVVAHARARAPAMVNARGDVRVADSAMVGARLAPLRNPELAFRFDTGHATKDVWLEAILGFPVELGGQRGARIEEADRLASWRRLTFSQVQAAVTGMAVATYGEAIVAEARVAEAKRGEVDARTEAAMWTARLNAGDATKSDVATAEAEVARWEQLRVEAELARTSAITQLVELTGDTIDAPPLGSPPGAPPLREGWSPVHPQALAATAPRVRAAGAEASLWEASRERAEAEAISPLTLMVTTGRGDSGEMRLGGGIQWAFPFVRRNQGEVARADAERDRALATQSAQKRAAEVQLAGLYEVYRRSVDAVAELDRTGIPAAQRAVSAADEAQRAGKIEFMRVLIARRDLWAARSRRLSLVEVAWRAYAEIATVKGGLP